MRGFALSAFVVSFRDVIPLKVGAETVKWFIVRGHYDLDDLRLLGGSRATKYYFFNGQRVAMDRAGVVYQVLGDHPRVSRPSSPGRGPT